MCDQLFHSTIRQCVFFLALLLPVSGFSQSIEEYLDQAIDNHPQLNAAEADRQAAMERAKGVSFLNDPTLTAGLFLFPVETRVGPQRGNVQLMQQFPWFGTLDAREDVHLAEASTEAAKYNQDRLELERSLKKAWYDLYRQERTAYWQEELIESLGSLERLAEAQYAQGKGTMADVVRIEIEREEAAFTLQDLKDRKPSLIARFNAIMHRPSGDSVTIADTLLLQNPAIGVGEQWKEHPEYLRLDRKQSEWEAKASLTEKKRKPSFGLGLNYIVTAERDVAELEDNGKDALMPMIQVRLPIYSKKYESEQAANQLKASAMDSRKENWRDQWNARLEEQEYAMRQARERYQLLKRQISNTNRAKRLLMAQYRNDEANVDEVLRMVLQLIGYRKEQVESLVRFNKSKAEWMYLMNQK